MEMSLLMEGRMMTRPSITVSNYIGGKAVDYAKEYWNSITDDGRVLTSHGVEPACGSKGIPNGTEFIHEAAWSEAYDGPTQGDIVLLPASGSSMQEKTESFTFKGVIWDKLKKKITSNPDKLFKAGSEWYALNQNLVRNINYVEMMTNGDTIVLQATDWPTLGDYLRDDLERPKPACTIRLLLAIKGNEIKTLGSGNDFPKGTKFNVNYTYCEKGQKISWRPIDDCCHFVSCCLIAGGLPVWPNDHPLVGGMSRPCAKGQHDVNGLYRMFKWMAQEKNGALVEIIEHERSWRDDGEDEPAAEERWNKTFKEKMSPGDVVLYYRKDAKTYVHSAIYVGTMQTAADPVDYPRITCHTYARYPTDDCTWDDCRWHINRKDDWGYALIHIKPYEPTEI